MAVPEVHFFPVQGPASALGIRHSHRTDQGADFAPVGTGIHKNGAPQAAGDPGSEFQAGQSSFCRRRSQPGKKHPCFHPDGGTFDGQLLQAAAQFHHTAPDAFVQDQQVGSVADYRKRDVLMVDLLKEAAHLFPGLR